MKVSPYVSDRLRNRKDYISLAIEKNPDFKGVYDRLVKILSWEALFDGNDIRPNRPYPWLHLRSRHFTTGEVEDIALNKFARYMHYELGGTLEEELKVRAYNAHKGNPMEDWLHALDEVAQQITYHWGTPLEAVA
ncbi:MAG: hypothetical protein PHH00_01515 [Candidatus Nanoarchaeia archaeon]|nr:hypothetical protein [Candidatus Nanoarchaeia archaeon]